MCPVGTCWTWSSQNIMQKIIVSSWHLLNIIITKQTSLCPVGTCWTWPSQNKDYCLQLASALHHNHKTILFEIRWERLGDPLFVRKIMKHLQKAIKSRNILTKCILRNFNWKWTNLKFSSTIFTKCILQNWNWKWTNLNFPRKWYLRKWLSYKMVVL